MNDPHINLTGSSTIASPSRDQDEDAETIVRTGAEILWEALREEGVEVVFGYPGGAILPAYDALSRSPIHHVLVRHEQGATHMADGYARASGRVGVAVATSGPGATNMVTGLATAMMDSSPIVCITGQVPTSALGSDAFQEADVMGITMPITKHNFLVADVRELRSTIRAAFHIARTGRPGPVLVDLPKDVQAVSCLDGPCDDPLPSWGGPRRPPPAHDLEHAQELLRGARRPVILAGHGVIVAGGERELRSFAETGRIPVALTLLGIGGFPGSHPLCLGMMGMHGQAWCNRAIQEADLLVALGMRFDDRVTGTLDTYARGARKIHVDIDPTEIGKNVPVDCGLIGDVREVLAALRPGLVPCSSEAWLAEIATWRERAQTLDFLGWEGDGRLYAPHVLHDLWRETGGEAVVVTDVGQHQMWEAQYYRHEQPRTLITSGGLGTMGFALPAALGAKLARPEAEVWAVVGDGGFQMTLCELATYVQEGQAVKIALLNNSCLGMVRQWQELFYEERYVATPLADPDFVKLAEAFGIPARRVARPEDIPDAVAAARAYDGPYLVELVIEPAEIVYPMVATGCSLDAMVRRPAPDRIR